MDAYEFMLHLLVAMTENNDFEDTIRELFEIRYEERVKCVCKGKAVDKRDCYIFDIFAVDPFTSVEHAITGPHMGQCTLCKN
jgi:uncharacterized UBP type Zn finger protein